MANHAEKCPEKCPEKVDDVKSFGWGARHVQVGVMALAVTCLMVVRSSMGVAVLAMTDQRRANDTSVKVYDWDKKTQGLILSSFFWGYVAMQVPAAELCKRFGGKPVYMVALVGNALLSFLVPWCASWGGWMVVCALRGATGLTQACLYPGSHTLLGRWLPDNERTALSGVVFAGVSLGPILAMPLSGFLADTRLGWPLLYYAMGALLLLVSGLWWALTASTPAQHRWASPEERAYVEKDFSVGKTNKALRTPWRCILTSVPFWALVVGQIGTASASLLFFIETPTYLEKGLGISLKNSASLTALPYVGCMLCSTACSTLSERLLNRGLLPLRYSRKTFNSIGAAGMAVGMVCMSYLAPLNTTLGIVSLIFSQTIGGAFFAGFMLNYLDMSPNFAGVLYSVSNLIASTVCIFVPILNGYLLNNDPTELAGWRKVFLLMTALLLVSDLVYVLYATSERQPWDDPDYLLKTTAHSYELTPMSPLKEKTAAGAVGSG